MVTEDEARQKAEEFFGTSVSLHEFELGWVAWVAQQPERRYDENGVPRPPSTTGGTAAVVDRRSGDVVPRPLVDPDTVAAFYIRDHG